MDEFFSGLKCRLRVSGLVADSIMMGIVNSAMEEAYDKVCSKKGDLERLNEKSRFCALAVMQLEWCLKFIQEEVDIYVAEGSRERAKLVSELTDTRDRIQKRLEETELAIAKKDKELKQRMENEAKLRQALESKVDELSSLHVTLEHEKAKSDRVREFRGEDRDNGFCELKNSLDQQFWNIKRKLEDGRVHSTEEVQKLNDNYPSTKKLEPELELVEEDNYNTDDKNFSLKSEEVQSNGCMPTTGFHENGSGSHVEVFNCCVQTEVTERNLEFEQMGTDIDILKEMMEVGFEMMANTISLSKAGLLEQQWEWSVEKEMVVLVLRGFLRDVEENFKTIYFEGQSFFIQSMEGGNSSPLMADIKSLHHELQQLLLVPTEVASAPPIIPELGVSSSSSSQLDFGCKGTLLKMKSLDTNFYGGDRRKFSNYALQRCRKSDSSLKFQESFHLEDAPEEATARHSHHVAEMIKNHETIIKKKTEEKNWLKGEVLREKGHCLFRRDKAFERVKKLIPDITSRLDRIIQGCAKSGVNLDDYEKGMCSVQKTLSQSILAEEEEVVASPEKLSNAEVSNSVVAVSIEEIKQLKQSREDFNVKATITEEINMIVFTGFLEQICCVVESNEMECTIKEDVYNVLFKEMVREWNNDRESHITESHTREEIYQIVFNEVINEIKSSVNLTLPKCQNSCSQNDSPKVSGSVVADSIEEIKQLKQAREDFNVKASIEEETNKIVFKGFLEKICFVGGSNETKSTINEDVYTVLFNEMVGEWNNDKESHITESHIREEIYQIVFNEVINDVKSSVNLTLLNFLNSWNQENSLEVRDSVVANSIEEIKQLKHAREDFNVKATITEEMNMIVLKGFLEEICCVVEKNEMESTIKEEVYTVLFKEMVMDKESRITENYTREEIYQIVFNEVINDIKSSVNITLPNCQNSWNQDNLLEVSDSVVADSIEEIKQLKQAREDFNVKASITEEMNIIVFKGFLEWICCVVESNEMESTIKEDVYTVLFKEMVREWNNDRESHFTESHIKEEIYRAVFNEFNNDIKSSVDLTLLNSQNSWNQDNLLEDMPLTNLLVEISEGNHLMLEQGSKQNTSKEFDDVMIPSNELMEMDKNFDFDDWKLEDLDEECIEQDGAFDSIKSKLEKALQQIIASKEQLEELGHSLRLAVGSQEEANHQKFFFEGIAEDMPKSEKQRNALESIVIPLKDFSRAIIDFECIIYEKQGFNIRRLDKAKHQLDQLIQHVYSIKAKELLYRKAFLRRCYSLQTAEAEVDLLGDKVDALLCLLEKIYIALYRYSPILQHYVEIMDILKLIRKELTGENAPPNLQ